MVRRALTGHVTQEMQQHYSNVGTDEKRAAIAGALKLLADTKAAAQNQPPPPTLHPTTQPVGGTR